MSLLDILVAGALPLTPRFVVGRVARPYIAGETREDALRTIRVLNAEHASATVDVLGEFITELSEAERTAGEYEGLLDAIAEQGLDSNISVKLTALGLLLDDGACTDLVRGICRLAQSHGSFVRVDMEDSPVTERTLALVRRLRAENLPVGAVLQAYLHRTDDDARALAEEGVPVRLCKGIYRESPTIAWQRREEIRESYRRNLRVLLEGDGRVAIATHDEVLVAHARELIADLGVPKERYEYQMLLGVRQWLRDELLSSGERVRVYVPFGAAWYAYSVRRLRENPTLAGHVFKAMVGFK